MNLNAHDRFCLDGQRLMLVSGSYGASGSVYGTEKEGFSRVTANAGNPADGPEWFKVVLRTTRSSAAPPP